MWGKPLIFYLHRKSRRENRWIHSAAFSMETGRKTASGHRLYTCGEAATTLLRPEDTVAGIAKAREDVFLFIQLTVEGGGIDRNVRMRLVHDLDTFRGSDETHEFDILDAFFFHHVDGCDGAASGSEHRIDEDEVTIFHIRELAIVFDRLGGDRIAVETDDADAGRRHEFGEAFHHAEAGAQDRDDAELLAGDLFSCRFFERCLDSDIFERQIAGELIAHQERDLLQQTAELTGAGFFLSHNGQLVLDQRMINDMDMHNGLLREIQSE